MTHISTITSDDIRRQKKVRLLRASIATVAKMLTKKKNLKLTLKGAQAYCKYNETTGEPELICLPYIPDDASDILIEATQGFLDHECAHALFTDFTVLVDAAELKVPMLHNMYEDVFIERRNLEVFPGSKATLPKPRYRMIEMIGELVEKMEAKGVDDPTEWWKTLCVCAVRSWAGHTELVDFMTADKWAKIEPITERLEKSGVKSACKLIKDSQHALDLAIQTKNVMLDFEEERQKEESGKSGEKGDPSEESGDDESEGEPQQGDQDSNDESTSGDFDDQQSEDQGEEKGEDSADSSDEDGDDSSEGNGDPSDEEQDGNEDGMRSEDGKDQDGSEEIEWDGVTERDRDDSDWREPNIPSIEAAITKSIEREMIDHLEGGSYVPYTNEADTLEVVEPSGRINNREIDAMEGRVSSIVGALQSQLEGILMAMRLDRWQPGLRSGKLNGSSLHKLRVSDDRVFRRREEREEKNSAVSLVLDCSGSMSHDSRYARAAESAWALAQTMDRLDIPCEIIGYTTDYAATIDPEAYKFSRWEPIRMMIFKGYDEPFNTDVKNRLTQLWSGMVEMDQNIDGESVRIAADRLLLRDEERHIMLVLSDGYPAGGGTMLNEHLKYVVAGLEEEGVECVGVGIQSESVRDFYPQTVVLNDISELAGEVLGKLREFLSPHSDY